MQHQHAAFFFRRDLRLDDNSGLRAALESSRRVTLFFTLDPRQGPGHRFFSRFGFGFMADSIRSLDRAIRARGGSLELRVGSPEALVPELAGRGFDALFWNRDYTPFSRSRDKRLADACAASGIAAHARHDVLLHPPGEVTLPSGEPYRVFTPFYKRAQTIEVARPVALDAGVRFEPGQASEAGWNRLDEIAAAAGATPRLRGGREEALEHLARVARLAAYDSMRDFPAVEGTTELSPHLKFGTISPREVLWASRDAHGNGHGIERELYWRDFMTQLAAAFPVVFGRAFRPEFEAVAWRNDPGDWARWTAGTTGFPIVDAGMRELAATGSMHNRTRMIVASFLVKDLLIDWREGEAWFAQHLTDYDPAVNNGSWQWASSTGADAAPYFRIFNPWLQQAKFDPDATYIKRWVPELDSLDAATIHRLHEAPMASFGRYPQPMLHHHEASERAKAAFSAAAGKPLSTR
jgi:deoxyribodipyrimidine photo-lyase